METFNEDKTQVLVNISDSGITTFPLDLDTAIYIPVENYHSIMAGTHVFQDGIFCKKDLINDYHEKLETTDGIFYVLPIIETRNDLKGSRLYIVIHTDGSTYYLRYVDNIFTEVYLINNPESRKFTSYRVSDLTERSDYTINPGNSISRYEKGKLNREYILENNKITCLDGRIYNRSEINEGVDIERLHNDLTNVLVRITKK